MERKARLKNLCTSDLYFLLRYGLNRKDADNDWCFARCREVQANPNGFLDLWGREHYKSTIITFALTIQNILQDPEITVGIFSHTRPNAKKFLVQIKNEFEKNHMLKMLFPDILWADPARESPKWSEDGGLVVKRKNNPKESTVEAYGLVDGQPTGAHFKLRVYDDVVTLESVSTPEQIEKTTNGWELSVNLGQIEGWERYIGTRYKKGDTYQHLIKEGIITPRIHPATHNGRIDGRPVFFSEAEWAKRKKLRRKVLAAQYMQNPLADELASFMPDWLRAYEVRPRTLNIYITVDPSKGRSADSDNTAFAVVGIGVGGAMYLLDGYCHRMGLARRWVLLKELYLKWSRMPGVQHVEVGYERYGAQTDDEYFQKEMEKPKEPKFIINELNWVREGPQSKTDRVERLEPDFRNSRFFLPLAVWHNARPCVWKVDRDPNSKNYQEIMYSEVDGFTKAQLHTIQGGSPDLVAKALKRKDEEGQIYDLTERFMEEYINFPSGEYKDLVDATSRIYDLEIRPPVLINRAATEPTQYHDS